MPPRLMLSTLVFAACAHRGPMETRDSAAGSARADIEPLRISVEPLESVGSTSTFFDLPADWQTALKALNCSAFHVYHKALDWELVPIIHAVGCQVAAFTVNDAREAEALYGAAVDCVITDAPERALAAYANSRKAPM